MDKLNHNFVDPWVAQVVGDYVSLNAIDQQKVDDHLFSSVSVIGTFRTSKANDTVAEWISWNDYKILLFITMLMFTSSLILVKIIFRKEIVSTSVGGGWTVAWMKELDQINYSEQTNYFAGHCYAITKFRYKTLEDFK